jgi:hypothetical protein
MLMETLRNHVFQEVDALPNKPSYVICEIETWRVNGLEKCVPEPRLLPMEKSSNRRNSKSSGSGIVGILVE